MKRFLGGNRYGRALYAQLKILLTRISPVLASQIMFRVAMGHKLNLKSPRTFNEKLQWLKLYWRNPLVALCTDKYEVRKYIAAMDCAEILNDLYCVYDQVEDIEWDKLPRAFVLKCTHGCGANILCSDKTQLNIEEVKGSLLKWMSTRFALKAAEMQYDAITPRIVCERFLSTDDGKAPVDYKFYCFNGNPERVMVCSERSVGHATYQYFSLEGKPIICDHAGLDASPQSMALDPAVFQNMINYARRLSQPFPFVRVDLYYIQSRVIFGELTFTPAGGLDYSYLPECDLAMGQMIRLPWRP